MARGSTVREALAQVGNRAEKKPNSDGPVTSDWGGCLLSLRELRPSRKELPYDTLQSV